MDASRLPEKRLPAALLLAVCLVLLVGYPSALPAQTGCSAPPASPDKSGTLTADRIMAGPQDFPAPPPPPSIQECPVYVTVPKGRTFVILDRSISKDYWVHATGYCTTEKGQLGDI